MHTFPSKPVKDTWNASSTTKSSALALPSADRFQDYTDGTNEGRMDDGVSAIL